MTPIVTLGLVFTERLSGSGVLVPLGFRDDFLVSVPKLEVEVESEVTWLRRGEGSREVESERSLLLDDDFENFERKFGAMISYDKLRMYVVSASVKLDVRRPGRCGSQ